jgi:phosphatidylglycerophosphate synthase
MLGASTVGLVAVVILASVARVDLSLSAAYVFKAEAWFLIVATIAIDRFRRFHPFARVGPANQVTLVRAVLVALIAGLIGEASSSMAAYAIVIASLVATMLDGVDGWLARRTRLASAFGARFDMEVDALLILILAILVWRHERAGAWIVLAGLLRYLFVVAGWALPWMRRPLMPSVRRQAICVVQIGGLILAMTPLVPPALASPIAAIALAALSYSFLVDTIRLWRAAGDPVTEAPQAP